MWKFVALTFLVLIFGQSLVSAIRCACTSQYDTSPLSTAQLQEERYETRVTLEGYGMQVRFPSQPCGSDGYCDTDSITAGVDGGMTGICWNYTGPFSPMTQDQTPMVWRDCAAFQPSTNMPGDTCLDLSTMGVPGGKRCTCQDDNCNIDQTAQYDTQDYGAIPDSGIF